MGLQDLAKSTTARLLAQNLKITHIDTGAMYRVVTWGLLKKKIDLNDSSKVKSFLEKINFFYKSADIILFDGESVSSDIRKKEITADVSLVSSLIVVRKFLVNLQREMGKEIDCVIEGRDIGSVVFPNADYKFFLTADIEVRANADILS